MAVCLVTEETLAAHWLLLWEVCLVTEETLAAHWLLWGSLPGEQRKNAGCSLAAVGQPAWCTEETLAAHWLHRGLVFPETSSDGAGGGAVGGPQ